jgi:hypothetical protein
VHGRAGNLGDTGASYDTDYFRFDLPSLSKLTAAFTFQDLGGTANAFSFGLYNEDAKLVYTYSLKMGDWQGDTLRDFAMYLVPGRYYVRINPGIDPAMTGTAYTLRLEASPAVAERELNNSFETATELALGTEYEGAGSSGDVIDTDYWAFDVPTSSRLGIWLAFPQAVGTGRAYTVEVRDAADVTLFEAAPTLTQRNGPEAFANLAMFVGPGRYFIRVYCSQSMPLWGKTYRLKVDASATLSEAEFNTTIAQANPIALSTPYSGALSTDDGPGTEDTDYYYFDLTAPASITASLDFGIPLGTGTLGEFGIYGSAANAVATSKIVGTGKPTAIVANLGAGRHYLRVYGFSFHKTWGKAYTVRVDAAAPAPVREPLAGAVIAPLAARTYTGKPQCPAVSATLGGVQLKQGADYTVMCSNNVNIGRATVTLTGIGAYDGAVSTAFSIVPKAPKIAKIKAAKKTLTVKWGKVAKATSYKVSWRVKGASKWKTKTVKASKTSYRIAKLTSKKKYEVRVQTLTKVGGKNYASAWSKVKRATVR